MPTSPEDLLAYLGSLSIVVETVDHPPLHTVEDSRALRGDIPGGHTKNLFVKDKKDRLFLLVLGETTAIDLKRVHEKIGAQGRVSFGSAELLEEAWGVRPGAVTPFGAINDQAGKVRVVLDEAMNGSTFIPWSIPAPRALRAPTSSNSCARPGTSRWSWRWGGKRPPVE